MQQKLRLGAIALALLGSVTLAAAAGMSAGAQTSGNAGMSSETAGAQGKLHLSATQQQSIRQDLASEQEQTAPSSFEARVGEKLPSSLNAKKLPSDVASKVPEAKSYHYVRLSDRVLLVDPSSQEIAEIIPLSSSTTGMGTGDDASGKGSSESGGKY
jgi:Protein of unknown function (DUF1236)